MKDIKLWLKRVAKHFSILIAIACQEPTTISQETILHCFANALYQMTDMTLLDEELETLQATHAALVESLQTFKDSLTSKDFGERMSAHMQFHSARASALEKLPDTDDGAEMRKKVEETEDRAEAVVGLNYLSEGGSDDWTVVDDLQDVTQKMADYISQRITELKDAKKELEKVSV